MMRRFVSIFLETALDLKFAIVYAAMVGLFSSAIMSLGTTDGSYMKAAAFTGLLPTGVILLIACDAALSAMAEWRCPRRASGRCGSEKSLSQNGQQGAL